MTPFPPSAPQRPGWQAYLPRPKVVAATLTALLVVGLLTVADTAGVDLADWADQLLVTAGAAAGGYLQPEES